jgi:hypothetical protein
MVSTVFQTVLSGVFVFVLGQIFLKLIIEPVYQFKKTRADIAHTLIRYAHAFQNPKVIPEDLFREAYDKLRMLSGQLYADMELIPAYKLLILILLAKNIQRLRRRKELARRCKLDGYRQHKADRPTHNQKYSKPVR